MASVIATLQWHHLPSGTTSGSAQGATSGSTRFSLRADAMVTALKRDSCLCSQTTEEPIASVRSKGNSRALGKHQDVTDGQDEGGSELFLLPTGLVFPYTSYLLSEAKTTMKPISHGRKVRCKGEGKQPHSLHSSPGFTTSETRFSVTGQAA